MSGRVSKMVIQRGKTERGVKRVRHVMRRAKKTMAR